MLDHDKYSFVARGKYKSGISVWNNGNVDINGNKLTIYNPNSYADAPRTADNGGELTIINKVEGYDTSGPTIMFKGIWEAILILIIILIVVITLE